MLVPILKSSRCNNQSLKSPDSVSMMSCIQTQTSLVDRWGGQVGTSLPHSRESPSTITYNFFLVLLGSSGTAFSDASSVSSVISALTLFWRCRSVGAGLQDLPPGARGHQLLAFTPTSSLRTHSVFPSFGTVVGLGYFTCRVSEKIQSLSFCHLWSCTESSPSASLFDHTDLPLVHTSCKQEDHHPCPRLLWEAPGIPAAPGLAELHPSQELGPGWHLWCARGSCSTRCWGAFPVAWHHCCWARDTVLSRGSGPLLHALLHRGLHRLLGKHLLCWNSAAGGTQHSSTASSET